MPAPLPAPPATRGLLVSRPLAAGGGGTAGPQRGAGADPVGAAERDERDPQEHLARPYPVSGLAGLGSIRSHTPACRLQPHSSARLAGGLATFPVPRNPHSPAVHLLQGQPGCAELAAAASRLCRPQLPALPAAHGQWSHVAGAILALPAWDGGWACCRGAACSGQRRHPGATATRLRFLASTSSRQNPKGPYRTMEELWDEPELD